MLSQKLFLCAAAVLFVAETGAAQSTTFIYDQLRRPPGTRYFRLPVGLCEDYPEESTTPAKIRGDMETLKRSGTKFLRIAFGWDSIEEDSGKYNWLFWDDLVNMAVREYGITLIPYICYTPRWNSTGDSTNFWNHTPKDYQAYGRFVGVLVNRYKDRIKSWELWNEPDITEYWSGNAEDLSRLIKIGSDAVRTADPDAIVVCPGLAYNTTFTLSLFRDFGVSPYVDVVNIHNYNETWGGSPLEAITGYVNTIADIIERYGNNQSLWMAEVGYSNFRKGAYVSNQYTAYFDYEHTPRYQAIHMLKTLTLLNATDKLSAVAWYRIEDLPQTQDVIGDVNNRYLGVVMTGFEAKPAEKAIAFLHTLFSQETKCIDDRVMLSRTIGSESETHCFENEDGSVLVIGWLRTHVPGKRGNDRTGMVKDTRKESLALSSPWKLSAKASLYDETGVEKKFEGVKVFGKETAIKDMTLMGGEIFILKISR